MPSSAQRSAVLRDADGRIAFRNGGGLVDAPDRRVVGAEREYPLCAAYLPGPTRNREGEGKRRIDPEERDEAPTGSRTRGSTSSTRRTRFGSRPMRRCPPARRVGVPEARRSWGGSWCDAPGCVDGHTSFGRRRVAQAETVR